MLNTTPKNNRGGEGFYDSVDSFSTLRYGVVKAIESDYGGTEDKGFGRIKVYIKGPIAQGGDGDTPDNALSTLDIKGLPWCFPMLPKHLFVQPKVNDIVWVFFLNRERQHADRLYIGPIASSLTKLDGESIFTAMGGFSFAPNQPLVAPSQVIELKGVFPNKDDISIQGKYNTDIIQKRNEVVIRAGKFDPANPNSANPYPMKFNAATQGFIQIKNDVVTTPKTQNQEELKGTVVNVVANKINLITHRDGSPRFDVTNQDNLIDDSNMSRILSEAHQLPFGDVLLEYLTLLEDAVLNHVHNGSGNPATDLTTSGNKQTVALLKTKSDELRKSMLSKNVRIN